jgi:glucocorticoid receptor DNA-binding factor 1
MQKMLLRVFLCSRDWPLVQQHIKEHIDFNQFFFECPEDMSWMELDETQDEGRIPYDVLDTIEAETVFKNHLNVLQQEQKRLESVSTLFSWLFDYPTC